MKILVTGTAGFIGSFVSKTLLQQGHDVVGLDNLNDYYDVNLKQARLNFLKTEKGFRFLKMDVASKEDLKNLFATEKFQRVVHLAAQAGVRYSLENPYAYIDSNLLGFLNILEGCRHNRVEHLVYASTSSVYGLNRSMPFSVHQGTDHPASLYAATKKSNEMMAHSYSHMFQMPTTGLRFFTVYGPWGRPDMALFLFTRNILEGKPIDVFNFGHHKRDFTFVDDIVKGVVKVTLAEPPVAEPKWNALKADPGTSSAPYRVYNIGNSNPVELEHYISVIEEALGKKAIRNNLPLQPGDIPDTEADVSDLERDFDYKPNTSVEVGVKKFVSWYREYYKI